MNMSPRAQVISIIIVSFIFGVGYNAVRTENLSLLYQKPVERTVEEVDSLLSETTILSAPEYINLESAKEMYDREIIFIDARDEEEFAEGHIKGAILAPSTPELVQLTPDRSTPIVTYCGGGDCDVSMQLAEELMYDWDYERIFVYLGGWPEWKAAEYPVE
jgi:rhodanese-related sulfurtransferase|tara:strand:- start:2047 stop:2529 length:483 start_codon:yes stop_codon:yes gene_type:complete